MSRRSVIPRRMVLRGMLAGGISVVVPLPRLAGMLNGNGTAYAAGDTLPTRFGLWFFGNGIIPNRWVPGATGSGDAWQLSEQLSPLQQVKPWLSVMTGFTITVPNTVAHSSMPSQALTGANVGALPTIDQVIAPIISGGTIYPTGLHVGVGDISGANTTGGAYVSLAGPNMPNPPQFSPATLFMQLMQYASTGSNGGTTSTTPDPELAYRNLVVDAVLEDANALRTRLGTDDQKRLDAHLDGLNQLQGQIMAAESPKKATGTLTNPDTAYPNRGDDGTLTRQRGQAFSDLLVFALSADLTRIFSYMMTSQASHQTYENCGLDPVTFHEDYGHRLSPKGVSYATDGFNTGVKYAMSLFSDTLTKMANTPDGAGTLLDNSCIFSTSCVSESQTHGGTDYPLLVAGHASGKIKGNQHIRQVGDNVSKVAFQLLQTFGGTQTSFGQDEGQVTSGVPALLA